MAKIELEMKANTQGAVQNLKATQANINKVADAFVKLQNEGVGLDKMNNAVSGFYDLVDRLASSMFASGEASSYFAARMKVLDSALQSASQMSNGDFSQISDSLRQAYTEAENAALAINEMTDAEMELEKEQKPATSALSKFGSKLATIIGNITIFRTVMNLTNTVVNGFKRTISDSLKVAAEGEQVYSKLSTVFGEYSNAMQRADEVASHLGVSSQTAASALSTVGDLLQAQGATASQSLELASDWVEKFQDIIAFKDVDMSLEEFAQNFMAGAAGNIRNFRSFGSIVKESAVQAKLLEKGLGDLTGSELELQKMTIRAEMALEQQKNAFGATGREWNTMLSVSRRYDEAVKEMEENIGNALVPWVKTLKNTVAEVVQGWNDAIAARNAYKNGSLDFKSGKNVKTDVSDYSEFYSKLQHAMGAVFDKKGKIGSVLLEYGADLTDVNKALNEMAKNGEIVNTKGAKLAKSIAEQRSLASALSDAYNASKTELESYAQSLDSVMEKIQSVNGVNFVGSGWYERLEESLELDFEKLSDSQSVKGKLKSLGLAYGGYISEAVSESVSDIKGFKFGTKSEYKFGKADQWTDLEKRMEAFETLYQTLSGVEGVTQSMLEVIYKAWEADKKALQDHNEELEKAKALQSSIDSYNKTAEGYAKQASQIGMTDAEKTLSDLYAALGKAGKGTDLYESIKSTIDAFMDLQEAVRLNEEQIERTKRIDDAYSSKSSTISELFSQKNSLNDSIALQMRQLGMTGNEKAVDEIDLLIERAKELNNIKLAEDLLHTKTSLQNLQKATDDLEEAQKEKKKHEDAATQYGNSFMSASGQMGSIMDQISNGETAEGFAQLGAAVEGMGAMAGPIGLLLEELIKIVASLDVVTKLTSILSDSLTPVLNDFLEPFLPVISALGKVLSHLLETVLVPFYPYIQAMAEALLFAVGCVDIFISAIDDGFKWVVGNVKMFFVDMINGIIDLVNKIPFVSIGHVSSGSAQEWANIDVGKNIEDNWANLMSELQSIEDNTFGTWQNTKSDVDLSKLDALLEAQLITEEQYNQRAKAKQAGLNWDTVGASTTGYVSAKSHTTQVQAGAITININDANDSTEVKRQVLRALQDAGISVAGQAI